LNDTVLSVTPMPKPRMTRADAWKKRPVVVKYWLWCDEIRKECQDKGIVLTEVLSLVFVVPMPPSWSKKKKKEKDGTKHQQRPDLDNYVKAYKDSFKSDDSFVYSYKNISKVWGYTGEIIVKQSSHQ